MRKSGRAWGGVKTLAILSVLVAQATYRVNADDGVTATVWVEEASAESTVTAAGDVTVQFAAVGALGVGEACELIVGGTSPSNPFTGDLSTYTAVKFKIAGDGTAPHSITLKTATKIAYNATRVWQNSTPAGSVNAGEWIQNTVPFIMDQGWSSPWLWDSWSQTPAEGFAWDLARVDALALSISPSGSGAQSYTVSQFQLVTDEGATVALQLTPLQTYFPGVESIEDIPEGQDSDGDGMSDIDEILAGMNPLDASSVFAAKMSIAEAGNTITWDGVIGASYGVLRSTDLTSGFELIEGGIQCTVTGPMSYIDSEAVQGAPNFYKVVKY